MASNTYVSSRQEWLREAIASTRQYIEHTVKVNAEELVFARPGTRDYDAVIDDEACLACARETLKWLEAEESTIALRAEMRATKDYEES